MRCNLTEAEQKAALEVPFRCTGEEQEFIERCFIGYLFFEHEADENGRLGVTTECTRCGRKVWWTEREWKRFKQENDVKAKSNLLCPDCGCGVTLYPRGRLRNGKTLDEYRQVVLLRAIDGALRAVALGVWKHQGRWESDDAECCVKAAYLLAQVRHRPNEKKYSPSRNLIVPQPKDRIAVSGAELQVPRGGQLLLRAGWMPGMPQYIRYIVPEVGKIRRGEAPPEKTRE